MHEFSLIQQIIEIILEELPRHPISRVESVSLRIGQMRQVVPDALKFGFECLIKNTPLEGATLEVEHVPVRALCSSCRCEFEVKNWLESCPNCVRSFRVGPS
jgi:hydrogenase nickel incorporation protein HypA/HybF